MRTSRKIVVAALFATPLVTAVALVGCSSQPTRIGPTTQPGGIQTPEILFPKPDGGGIPDLPTGFHLCYQYEAPVTLTDGSVVNLNGCVYCADNPNDTTVYTQVNCKGNFHKGNRNPAPGQPANAPTPKHITNPTGSMSAAGSGLKFTVSDAFSLNSVMTLYGDSMTVNGTTVTAWVQQGVTSFAAGSTVTVKGDNGPVGDLLFWGFGVGEVDATTDTTDSLVIETGFDPEFGEVVVPVLNGAPQLDDIQFLPWRQP